MSKKYLKFLFVLSLIVLTQSNLVLAQNDEDSSKPINFLYSQNPKTKVKIAAEDKQSAAASNIAPTNIVKIADNSNANSASKVSTDNSGNRPVSLAGKTLEVVKRSNAAAISPTDIYKVGIGDVLFISLQNAPSQSASYFTVLNDGTIDYPLAGAMVSVADLTSEEIEDLLKQKIKLFENPQVAVRVREHASHSITVLGLVEKPGEKFLPREAMPLYYVRADAVVQSKATQAVVKHSNSTSETLDLSDAKNDNVLIFPGDIVEFKAVEENAKSQFQPQFYYIGGYVISVGQKEFHSGLTLTQAILASGGLRKPTVKKVTIRRKNGQGLLVATEVNLKAVNEGKTPDPTLESGDTIEVGN